MIRLNLVLTLLLASAVAAFGQQTAELSTMAVGTASRSSTFLRVDTSNPTLHTRAVQVPLSVMFAQNILAGDLAQSGAATGQFLGWTGAAWAPTTPSYAGLAGSVPIAALPVGTGSAQVAAGNDPRIAGAVQAGAGVDTNTVLGRTNAARAADVVNVADYGAICDGSPHLLSANPAKYPTLAAAQAAYPFVSSLGQDQDWAAIQAAWNAAVAAGGHHFVMPAGRTCVIQTTLNWTGVQVYSMLIDGAGATLIGKTSGTPIIDALGSLRFRMRDLTLIGSATNEPNIGMQIGRIDNTANDSSGHHEIRDITVKGSFTFAGFYNLNSETTLFDGDRFWNTDNGTSYGLVQDGANHWAANSAYIAEVQPVDSQQSFNLDVLLNCDIRYTGTGAGAPLWMESTAGHRYINTYVQNATGAYGAILFQQGVNKNTMLDMDVHFESGTLTAAFFVTGGQANPNFTGFSYRDQKPFAMSYLFAVDSNIASVSITDPSFVIGNSVAGQVAFQNPSIWTLQGGKATFGVAGVWNLAATNAPNTVVNQPSGITGPGVNTTPTTSGLLRLADSAGNIWSYNGQPAITGPVLAADGTTAACIDQNCFAWANQPAGAIVTGGDSGANTAELNVVSPAHPAPANQAMLKARLPTGPFTITVESYVTDPASPGYYTTGIALLGPTLNTIYYDFGASAFGSSPGIQTETDFGTSAKTTLASTVANSQAFVTYPIHAVMFQRITYDGVSTVSFFHSPTGVANSFTPFLTTTMAALNNPVDFGLYADAFEDAAGENYPSVSHVLGIWVMASASDQAAAPVTDPTQSFLTTLNQPTTDVLPSLSGLMPPDGLAVPSGTVNDIGVVFGSATAGANITTVQGVLSNFWTSYAVGNPQAAPIGSPADTGQGDNSTFAAVARTYLPGDPNAVHTMLPDGLLLSNNCSRNHAYCYPGLVYGGMIQASVDFLPGQTMWFRVKLGAGVNRWSPLWFFRQLRYLNGASSLGNTNGLASNGSFVRYCDNNANGSCIEWDVNDAFTRLVDAGVPIGQEEISWVPQYDGQGDSNITVTTPAYRAYMANTASFVDVQKNEEFEQTKTINCSITFCDIVADWEAATVPGGASNAHYMDVFIAPVTSPATPAVLISRIAMEFTPTTLGPNNGPFGLGLMLSAAQAIPGALLHGGSLPNYAAIPENDGIPNGWSLEIAQIGRVKADIVSPASYKPTN